MHVGELVPHGATRGAADFFHDLGDAILVQALDEQAFGGLVGANQRAGIGNRIGEVDEQPLKQIGTDGAQAGHDLGYFPDLVVFHHRNEFAGVFPRQAQQHHGRALRACEAPVVFFDFGHGCPAGPPPFVAGGSTPSNHR